MVILLDTNILLNLVEPTHAHHEVAVSSVRHLLRLGNNFCIVPQIFYEYWVVSTRLATQNGRGKTPEYLLSEIAYFQTRFKLLPETGQVFEEWKRLVSAHHVAGKLAHDTRLIAAMLVHQVGHLLTLNDADFRRFPDIQILTPFSVLPDAGSR